MSKKTLAAAALTALLLAGCAPAAPDRQDETPAAQESTLTQNEEPMDSAGDADIVANDGRISPAKRLAFVTQEGAIGVIEEMAEPSDLAALRKRTEDTSDLKYFRVSVDNRKGQEDADIDRMTGYDADGKEYLFAPIHTILVNGGMDSSLDKYEDDQYTLMDTFSKLSDKYVKVVPRRGVADVVVVTGDLPLPESFTELTVVAHLFEEDNVVHAEDIGDDAMLSFKVPEKHQR